MDSECSQCCKYADRKYKSGSCKLPRRNALQKSCYCSYTEIKGNKPAKMNLCTAHCYNKRFNTGMTHCIDCIVNKCRSNNTAKSLLSIKIISVATQNHYCGLCCTVMLASVKGGSCDNVGPYDWLGKRCYCVPETSTANRNVMSRSRSNGGARRRVVSV